MKVSNQAIHILTVLTVAGFAGSLFASPHHAPPPRRATPTVKKAPVVKPTANLSTSAVNPSRPDNASNRSIRTSTDRAAWRLQDKSVSAGATSAKAPVEPAARMVPTVYSDYTYINSNDTRSGAADGDTHSVSVGADVMTASEILLGFSYSYSDTDLIGRDYSTGNDSHFFSLYAAKSFAPWLSAGVTTGYGTTSTDTTINKGFVGAGNSSASADTWSASPFVTVNWANGPLFVSTTTGYQYTDYEAAGQHAVTVEGNVGYAVTDKLTVIAVARYFQELENEVDTGDDANWLTLGGRLGYAVTEAAQAFAGYEYDLLNDSYDNWTLRGGLSVSF
jgi:hypothetical protein